MCGRNGLDPSHKKNPTVSIESPEEGPSKENFVNLKDILVLWQFHLDNRVNIF